MPSDPSLMLLHFDASSNGPLRDMLLEAPMLFAETTPDKAKFIVFGNDQVEYVVHNRLYARWPLKCVCISETDTPTFFLPGLYAANAKSFLSNGRVETINYLISARTKANQELKKLDPRGVDKTYLYSFMGASNSWARKHLFRLAARRPDTLVESTDAYNHWTSTEDEFERRQANRQRYAEVMARSKFTLCPRGCGLSSLRLFEAMSLGVAPVIISDRWRPIADIDWSFAIFVKERDIKRIDDIMRSHQEEWRERGDRGRLIYETLLTPDRVQELVYRQLARVEGGVNARSEYAIRFAAKINARRLQLWWAFYGVSKRLALRVIDATGAPLPIQLHQPISEQLGRRDQC